MGRTEYRGLSLMFRSDDKAQEASWKELLDAAREEGLNTEGYFEIHPELELAFFVDLFEIVLQMHFPRDGVRRPES